MAKRPYAEQLKHPNWQRKRLEVLEAAGWACHVCGDSEKTLHVHHKHYVKGREVWEYPREELEALCEDCHEDAHTVKARIDQAIAMFPTVHWGRLLSLLVGYGEEFVDPAMWEFVDDATARGGQIAWFSGNWSKAEAFEMQQAVRMLGPDRVRDALRGALDEMLDERGLGPGGAVE